MRRWIPFLLIVLATVLSVVAYPHMPERVPSHWNVSGEVDGWSSRFTGAWLLPLVMAAILVVLRILPHIDPRRDNYEKFRGAYEAVVLLTLTFLLGMHIMLLLTATGTPVRIERIMPAAVGVMFIALGFILPRAHPNWFIGVRTPWTLTSNESWERTHRLGGTLFLLSGALTVITAIASPAQAVIVLMVSGIASAVIAIAYSYVVWKNDPARRSGA